MRNDPRARLDPLLTRWLDEFHLLYFIPGMTYQTLYGPSAVMSDHKAKCFRAMLVQQKKTEAKYAKGGK